MPGPCPNCGEQVEYDRPGPYPMNLATAYERKDCPHCGAPLVRQTDPIPWDYWGADKAEEN